MQLLNGDLKKEEHASAVQDWFYVDYGLANDMVVAAPAAPQVGYSSAWHTLFTSLGVDDYGARHALILKYDLDNAKDLQDFVNHYYGGVVAEVRDPSLMPNRRKMASRGRSR